MNRVSAATAPRVCARPRRAAQRSCAAMGCGRGRVLTRPWAVGRQPHLAKDLEHDADIPQVFELLVGAGAFGGGDDGGGGSDGGGDGGGGADGGGAEGGGLSGGDGGEEGCSATISDWAARSGADALALSESSCAAADVRNAIERPNDDCSDAEA
eukprot:3025511-Prymnesium_polylepis.1